MSDHLDMSRSALIARYIRRGLRQDRGEELAAETRAAQRLGDVIDAGLDDFRDTANQIQNLNAKTGVYAVAAFELVKQQHGEAAIRDALKTGQRRLRADELPNPESVAADTGDNTAESSSRSRDDRSPSVDDLEGS